MVSSYEKISKTKILKRYEIGEDVIQDLAEIQWPPAQRFPQIQLPRAQGLLGSHLYASPQKDGTDLCGTPLSPRSAVLSNSISVLNQWNFFFPIHMIVTLLTLMRTSLAWGGATSISSITRGLLGAQATAALHLIT